jgi:hypothetical protein
MYFIAILLIVLVLGTIIFLTGVTLRLSGRAQSAFKPKESGYLRSIDRIHRARASIMQASPHDKFEKRAVPRSGAMNC